MSGDIANKIRESWGTGCYIFAENVNMPGIPHDILTQSINTMKGTWRLDKIYDHPKAKLVCYPVMIGMQLAVVFADHHLGQHPPRCQ